jgi:hypothetical protein
MSGVDIAGLVEELVRAVSLRCHSHPGEERRSATERAAAAKQALLEALLAQAADLAEANRWGEILEAEQNAIAAALPGVRFMDPPDGGSPSLAEQVKRMRDALDAAEALAALKASEEARDATTKLADRYGVALMMIRAGCSNPQRFAGNILDDVKPIDIDLEDLT